MLLHFQAIPLLSLSILTAREIWPDSGCQVWQVATQSSLISAKVTREKYWYPHWSVLSIPTGLLSMALALDRCFSSWSSSSVNQDRIICGWFEQIISNNLQIPTGLFAIICGLFVGYLRLFADYLSDYLSGYLRLFVGLFSDYLFVGIFSGYLQVILVYLRLFVGYLRLFADYL